MRNQRSKSNNKSGLSTMGYLTMIVALAPSIAAFSGRVKPAQRAISRTKNPSSHNSGTGSTASVRSKDIPRTTLYYVSGADHDHTIHSNNEATKEHGSAWWNSIFAREESSAADDYLEFLNKRYNGILHEEEKEPETKGFNVINWLYQDSSEAVEAPVPERKRKRDDALYVLGLANLAGKKLLQKHRLGQVNQNEEANNNYEVSSKMQSAVDAEIVTTKPAMPVVAFFQMIAARRTMFVKSQSRSVRIAMAFLVRSLVTGPVKALRKLYTMGGGKKSVALTFAALAALSVLLRPLIRVAAEEGANTLSL